MQYIKEYKDSFLPRRIKFNEYSDKCESIIGRKNSVEFNNNERNDID